MWKKNIIYNRLLFPEEDGSSNWKKVCFAKHGALLGTGVEVETRIKGIPLSNKGLRNLHRAGGGLVKSSKAGGWGWGWGRSLWQKQRESTLEKEVCHGGLWLLQPT